MPFALGERLRCLAISDMMVDRLPPCTSKEKAARLDVQFGACHRADATVIRERSTPFVRQGEFFVSVSANVNIFTFLGRACLGSCAHVRRFDPIPGV